MLTLPFSVNVLSLRPKMNLRRAFAALSLCASVTAAQAGGFGGPPPFQNGSPLLSGIDGRYQAVASASNVTGIISFLINGGVQSGTLNDNSWVFFVDGNILVGANYTNISGGKINGILDAGTANSLGGEDNQLEGSEIILIPGNGAAGRFNGEIDLSSPVAAFSGKGVLTGTPPRVDQIIYILDISSFDVVFIPEDFNPVYVTAVTIPGSDFPETSFKFRGTRLTTTVSSSGTSSSSSSN